MSEYRVAARYAKSLIDIAREQNSLEVVFQDISSFLALLQSNAELRNLLKSPIITGDKKNAVLKKLFHSFNKNTLAFFDIIIRKKREMFLESVANAFIAQYNELKGISTAEVKTAVALDEKTHNEIRDFIAKSTGKNVEISASVDPALIGGIVIKIEDKLFDASIAGKLKKAKKELLNTYISK